MDQISLFDELRPELTAPEIDDAIVLRPYQRCSVDSVFEKWQGGDTSTLVTLPTGTGKSVVFSAVMDEVMRCQPDRRILVIAHREELILQAAQHAKNAGLQAGIEMGNRRVAKQSVVISTIQTQAAWSKCSTCHGEGCDWCRHKGKRRRFERFQPEHFSTLIIDEAHHCHIPGTSVKTVLGNRNIEGIQVGELVESWDGTKAQSKPVVDKFRYWYDGPIIEIETIDGIVSVTPNHRMYSNGKPATAQDIRDRFFLSPVQRSHYESVCVTDALSMEAPRNEALSSMLFGNASIRVKRACTESQDGLSSMLDLSKELSENIDWRSCFVLRRKQSIVPSRSTCQSNEVTVCKSEVSPTSIESHEGNKQPDGEIIDTSKNDGLDSISRQFWGVGALRKFASIWKWQPANSIRSNVAEHLFRKHLESCSDDRRWHTSVPLQGGRCVAKETSGSRVGWNLASWSRGAGCEERQTAFIDRLEDLQGGQRSGGIKRSEIIAVRTRHYTGYVYDIEVADNHNYVSNGLLSSNSTAETYRIVMAWYLKNPALRILMVTATPKRSDKIGLHNVCDSVAYEMEMRTAIKEGWLVPIRQQFKTVEGLDLSKVKTRNGDLADGERQQAFLGETDEDEERLLHAIAYPTIQAAKGRRTIVFAAGQEHAEKLTAAFNAYDGTEAEFVIDSTDRAERPKIIQRFRDGITNVLVNCMVFTEGFDVPDAAVCANARPTKSKSLYQQMIGRVTRPQKGIVDGPETAQERREAIAASDKPHCLVLDFTGDSGSHKLVSVADILAGDDVEPIDLDAALIAAEESGEPVDIEELIEKAKAAREAKEAREEEERQKRLQTRTFASGGTVHTTDVDIFGGKSFNPFEDYSPGPAQASQKQVAYLIKLGVRAETATKYSKRQAGSVIDKITKATGGDFVITFGKHAGKPIKKLPGGYRRWLSMNVSRQDVKDNIKLFEKVTK